MYNLFSQDGIEDLVQIQQGSGWVESVCFYDGQKEGGFVRSYVENRRDPFRLYPYPFL